MFDSIFDSILFSSQPMEFGGRVIDSSGLFVCLFILSFFPFSYCLGAWMIDHMFMRFLGCLDGGFWRVGGLGFVMGMGMDEMRCDMYSWGFCVCVCVLGMYVVVFLWGRGNGEIYGRLIIYTSKVNQSHLCSGEHIWSAFICLRLCDRFCGRFYIRVAVSNL